jgi:excisionase family DNA binding protein
VVSRSPVVVTRDEPARLSLGPASRLLGVDPDTLRRWADDGRIEAFVTPGGHRRFDRREIERVAAARRPDSPTPPLSSLGATAERLSRASRRSYGASTPEPRARDAVPAEQHPAFRADGRGLVASLVTYLDAPSDAARTAAEATAVVLIDDLARRLAAAGLSLTESVGLFVAARRPFLSELGVIARRRALDSDRTSALFESASALLDRLLVRFVEAYSRAGTGH